MKRQVIAISFLVILGFFSTSFSQDSKIPTSFDKVVWFGVDFTAAKCTLVTEDPSVIVNQYLKEINSIILTEQEKYNIKGHFKINELTYNVDLANEFNQKIDPSTFVITTEHKIDIEKVREVIRKYEPKENSGTGLIFVAENLNKVTKQGSYYVCFFDIKTKEIIGYKRMSGGVTGFGFRNYWARSIYNIMLAWNPA